MVSRCILLYVTLSDVTCAYFPNTPYVFTGGQGNEVYGGDDESVGIFLHRSSDNAIVKGEELARKSRYHVPYLRGYIYIYTAG